MHNSLYERVAFLANLSTGGEGIFTGADISQDKVIATGDTLLGSTVTQLGFSSQGLNNSGQIAFYATLADGISGIFRADPQTIQSQLVPESTNTWGIITFGMVVMGLIKKRVLSDRN
ncbi:DUF7453 family protein [Nostoc sp. 'Peltigera membranacea cyanobiont' 232]|uniref:DUF7453 family protein n=1 Tax=Nostoc sp. 'Peltigera membranacea cyanobiont' 232 TaxID=2014531 RepID=UPI001673C482|nr:hypothetical protein [Nostoc sp. 'Peltigera membranacea cyanobiont' 232]